MVVKNLGIKLKISELLSSKCNKLTGKFIYARWTVNFKYFILILVFYYNTKKNISEVRRNRDFSYF